MEGNARGSAQLRKEGNAAAPKVVGNSFTGCSPCFAYNTPMGGLIGANELKKKMLIEVEGQPYHVLDVFFATPTARGASTMVRTRLKNLLNGSVQEKSFRTNEKFPEPDVEIAVVSFLYSDTNGFHFMDQTSYEQFSIRAESVGDDHFYLKDCILLGVFKYNGAPVSLQLPQYVELQIASTEPGLR